MRSVLTPQVDDDEQTDLQRHMIRGWWTETITDGGAHYGRIGIDGFVTTEHETGEYRFRPLPHAIKGVPVAAASPADETHACPQCRARRRK